MNLLKGEANFGHHSYPDQTHSSFNVADVSNFTGESCFQNVNFVLLSSAGRVHSLEEDQ